jgi:hypothetical protein
MARTVHGITWKDDLAWMEEMKGERWNTFLEKQGKRWEGLLTEGVKESIPLLCSELEAAKKTGATPLFGPANSDISMDTGQYLGIYCLG